MPYEPLDEFDLEAMKEGNAIHNSYKRVGNKSRHQGSAPKKEDALQPGKEFDALAKYNVIDGKMQ